MTEPRGWIYTTSRDMTRLSSGRALVTRALFRDRMAYREWLEPIIGELA